MSKTLPVLAILFLLASAGFAKPCCPEDPEHMTFEFIRDNPGYLIGNHLGEDLPFVVRWWFYNEKVNVYSAEGIFVIGFEIKGGKAFGYNELEYGKPTIEIYAEEDAVDDIWQAEHMSLRFLYELIKRNIVIRRIHNFYWYD